MTIQRYEVFRGIDNVLGSGLTTFIYGTTATLVRCLFLNLPLPPAVINEFGVETEDHYRAMRKVVFVDDERSGALQDHELLRVTCLRIVELDQAHANGPALTALVKKYAPEFIEITFKTPFDLS